LSPLSERIARRISRGGPITVGDYMAAALGDADHGYYRRADPLGAKGDFTTAPETSQLFGDLIGAWLIDCWDKLGRPASVNLVELGPGRGTLMADALRVGRRVPEWLSAIKLHLVEINPALRCLQASALQDHAPVWHDTLYGLPDGPTMLVANEFLDALPIRQLVYWDGNWLERLVDWNEAAGFHFVLAPRPNALSLLVPEDLPHPAQGSLCELSPAVIAVGTEIAHRIATFGGAALLIDYGHTQSAFGESLQAVRAHRMVAALENPGEADLSAHVDFAALVRVAREAGTHASGPTTQRAFLKALGIDIRADRLKRGRSAEAAAAIDRAADRLTGADAMGALFKVAAITPAGIVPAGFDGPANGGS